MSISFFELLNEGATELAQSGSLTYLEGLAEFGDALFTGRALPIENQAIHNRLQQKRVQLNIEELKAETVRKAFQLAVLKGMKGAIQPHHSMTPDAVCLFISYLVNKVTQGKETIQTVLDLAVGSGNLLSALLNQAQVPVKGYGYEVDETLLKLAFVSANLQRKEVDLFHQDSIQATSIPTVDVVVTDVPVGYYPKDEVAQRYELKEENGHSLIHHLMVERAIEHTKAGGFILFAHSKFFI